jgi:cyanophycinase
VTVGGTSAGASILSEHMIAFGDEGSAVISGSVRLAPGLGLTNRFIIDQHFRQRDRLGRLITALAYNPFAIGIGLDEDTAAFIGPDETVEVHGSGGVTVVDSSEVSYSSIGEIGEGQPVCVLGLRVHILVEGATFNLQTRLASAGGLVSAKQ